MANPVNFYATPAYYAFQRQDDFFSLKMRTTAVASALFATMSLVFQYFKAVDTMRISNYLSIGSLALSALFSLAYQLNVNNRKTDAINKQLWKGDNIADFEKSPISYQWRREDSFAASKIRITSVASILFAAIGLVFHGLKAADIQRTAFIISAVSLATSGVIYALYLRNVNHRAPYATDGSVEAPAEAQAPNSQEKRWWGFF